MSSFIASTLNFALLIFGIKAKPHSMRVLAAKNFALLIFGIKAK